MPTEDRRSAAALRIGIAGIAGRVGRLLVEEVRASGATLAGGTIRPHAEMPADDDVRVLPDIAALARASDVVIDFSVRDAVCPHAAALAEHGVAYVLGTTGLAAEDEAALDLAATRIAVVQSANYSPGVTLALAFAERLGAALPAGRYDAEIVEMHHREKRDAPSGTALALGRAVAAGRGVRLDDVADAGRRGLTGPRRSGAIGFAALRGGQVVGEHSLIFAADGEQLELTHRAFDRRVFAAGAAQAALWAATRSPGRYSMRDVLGV